jgi:predicted nucleic acid-binding protein
VPIAVADAGPLHYLVMIEAIDFLPKLFETVLTPTRVHDELSHASTPRMVRAWAARPPVWLHVVPTPPPEELPWPVLDDGERTAIALAIWRRADAIFIDERRGVTAALREGLSVVGTLGLLDRAAQRGFIDLAAALTRLKVTNFRYRPELLDALLAKHKPR